MNQELGNQVARILAGATTLAGQTKEFLQAHLPELARQIVAWELWSNAFPALCWLVALCVSAFLVSRHMIRAGKFDAKGGYRTHWDTNNTAIPIVITFGFVLMAAVPAFCTYAYCCVKPLVAPDLVVLDYIRAFVK